MGAVDEDEVPHAFIRGESGAIIKMDLPLHETIADKLIKGVLRHVNEDGSRWDAPEDDETDAAPSKPAASANKAAWVAWAIHNGATEDDADGATKQDLIDLYGG